MKKLYIDCDCTYFDHSVRLTKFEDEKEVYLEFHLERGNLWMRIKKAISYIFSNSTSINEVTLNEVSQQQIIEFLEGNKND